jgi:hypothetical protein
MNREEVDALHRGTTGNVQQPRLQLKEREDDVHPCRMRSRSIPRMQPRCSVPRGSPPSPQRHT